MRGGFGILDWLHDKPDVINLLEIISDDKTRHLDRTNGVWPMTSSAQLILAVCAQGSASSGSCHCCRTSLLQQLAHHTTTIPLLLHSALCVQPSRETPCHEMCMRMRNLRHAPVGTVASSRSKGKKFLPWS